MLSNIGRAAIRRVGAGASYQSTNRVLQSFCYLQRVELSNHIDSSTSTLRQLYFSLRRSYATAVKATKPKTKASTTANANLKTKKAAPKKPVKKAVKKNPKKKVAVKPKLKAKPKKKVLTEEQKKRATLKALKVTALTPPTTKPRTAWMAFTSEFMKENSGSGRTGLMKEAAVRFKSITTEELERLNHIANQNKKDNEIEYKKWIDSHTPDEIRLANNARIQLKKKTPKGSSKYTLLRDPRLPKQAQLPWMLFGGSRWSSGDFKGISVVDASKRIQQEWKELSPSERQLYEDQAEAQKRQYLQEYKTVFGRESQSTIRQSTIR